MPEVIRPLVEADAEALYALRIENRAFMAPYEPPRDEAYFTLDGQREVARNPTGLTFAILDDGALAGTITLSNPVFGPFRSATVGYWVALERNGRGLASRALAATVEHAFGEVGLHRVEAATLTDNAASQRVLEKTGFERIGVARRYLHIGDAWRDHILFQRTSD
jgi:ribosomal-protein-alanine N-acetyltransferase